MAKHFITLIIVLLTFAGVNAAEGEQPLSLKDAIAIVQMQNHEILMARAQTKLARGQGLETWQGLLPSISITEGFTRSSDPVAVFGMKLRQEQFAQSDFSIPALNQPDPFSDFTTSLVARQPLLNFDALFAKRASSHGTAAAEASETYTRQVMVVATTRVYFAIALAEASLKTTQDALASAQRHHRDAMLAFDQGLVHRSELLLSEVRVAELQEAVLTASAHLANARDALNLLLGLDDNSRLYAPSDTLPLAAAHESTPVGGVRMDLQAAQFQAAAASNMMRSQQAKWLPRLNGFASLQWHSNDFAGNEGSNWTIGMQLEWQIFEGLGKAGRFKQAKAQKELAEIKYRHTRNAVIVEKQMAARAAEVARQRIAVASHAATQAAESLRLAEERFEQGLEKVADLLDKETRLSQARLRALKARYDYMIAKAELALAVGNIDLETDGEKE